MTKNEFIAKLKDANRVLITDSMYEDIEFVYRWYPCIDETAGKDQIVNLFDIFGYRVIKDMLPTAREAKRLREEIAKKEDELRELRWKLNCLEL